MMGAGQSLPARVPAVAQAFFAEGAPPTTFGVVGATGRMGSGIAALLVSQGFTTLVSSRDPAKAAQVAARLNEAASEAAGAGAELARAVSHAELLAARPTVVWLACGPAGVVDFIAKHGEALKGQSVSECTAWFASVRWGGGRPAPEPHVTTLTYFKELAPETSWLKCWQSVMSGSIAANKKQPMEVAGDDAPKAVAIRLLAALGWEPLDCGGVAEARLLERQGPAQMKHPKQAEDDGEFSKWYPDGDKSKYPGELAEQYR